MKGMSKMDNMYPSPMDNSDYMSNYYRMDPCPYSVNRPMCFPDYSGQYPYQPIPFPDENRSVIELKDYGPEPFVVDIEAATKQNNYFRTALWTGSHLQLTLMNINVGEDIGLEVHPDLDQFIRIEEGQGLVKMGDNKCNLDFQRYVYDDFAFIIPAGKWHNLINMGNIPLKLYSIYAPPQHPYGTVHQTKAIAEAAEENYGH